MALARGGGGADRLPLTEATALEAGEAAFAGAKPGRHNAFKIELGRRAVARAALTASKRS